MSDFKKNATPPVPTDDYSPSPALGMAFNTEPETPTTNQDQADADRDLHDRAAAYWHPAWAKVQERFEQELAARNTAGGANTHRDLPADEFKIRMIVDADVVSILETIMEDVKSAVAEQEQQPKRQQQSKSPGA